MMVFLSIARKLKRYVYHRYRQSHTVMRYVVYILQERLKGLLRVIYSPKRQLIQQSVLNWTIPWPELNSPDELKTWLQNMGVEFSVGGWTIYIPPQPNLHRVLGTIPDHYPNSAGYKILKNFRHPNRAQYCFRETANVEDRVLWKKRGNVFNNLKSANFLFTQKIGPRCWDITHWYTEKHSYTVFVVEHITGKLPSKEQSEEFITVLQQLSSEPLLQIVTKGRWQDRPDFQPEAFNGNLLVSETTGKLQYIDFQNFVVDSQLWIKQLIKKEKGTFHFGKPSPLTQKEYLYQSVPGSGAIAKRNISQRWQYIRNKLSNNGISIQGRVVLDIGCNQGMVMFQALNAGALWALGWDRPQVVQQTEVLLFSLGASRFDVFSAELDAEYSLQQDIPQHVVPHINEGILFYLSVRNHIGMMRDLALLPWRVLVYEGHRDESVESMKHFLDPLLCEKVELIGATQKSDGPGGVARPMCVLIRK